MGVPPSSANCLVAIFLDLDSGAEAIRVPNPAAGIITTTFIEGSSVYERETTTSMQRAQPGPRVLLNSIGCLLKANRSRKPPKAVQQPPGLEARLRSGSPFSYRLPRNASS